MPAAVRQSAMDHFSPERVRRDFPVLEERINGRPLIWLDNAATTQKPRYHRAPAGDALVAAVRRLAKGAPRGAAR